MSVVSNFTTIIVNNILTKGIGNLYQRSIASQVAIINPVADSMEFKDGETVKVPKFDDSTARKKAVGVNYTYSDAGGSLATLGVPEILYREFKVSTTDLKLLSSGKSRTLETLIMERVAALGQDLDEKLFESVTSFTQSVSTADMDDAAIIAARLKLDNAKVTEDDRHLIVTPTIYNSDLLSFTKNENYNTSNGVGIPSAGEAIRMARIGFARGFMIHSHTGIEVTAGSPAVHNCVAMQRGALAAQFLRLYDDNDLPGAQVYSITDQGIQIRMVVSYDDDADKYKCRVETAVATGIYWDLKGVRIEASV